MDNKDLLKWLITAKKDNEILYKKDTIKDINKIKNKGEKIICKVL